MLPQRPEPRDPEHHSEYRMQACLHARAPARL